MMMANINLRSQDQRQGRRYWFVDIRNIYAGLTIALFLYGLVWAQTGEALEHRCGNSNVVVHSANLADAKSVCEGAADAIGFLGAQGIKAKAQTEVLVVDELPDSNGSSAYGRYSERRAYLLTFSKIAQRGTAFKLPFDRALYRSLATHEVAHAIAASNFRIANPQIEAEEYIAYVAMFATMPATYRTPLLERFVDEKYDNEMQINTLVYLLDPFRFGVLAYKHFMNLGNGADFLQQVLGGRALLEFAY